MTSIYQLFPKRLGVPQCKQGSTCPFLVGTTAGKVLLYCISCCRRQQQDHPRKRGAGLLAWN